MTNGLSHPYHLVESTLIFMSNFSFLFHCSMKFVLANRIAPDWTPRFANRIAPDGKPRFANRIAPDEPPRFAASHLGLFCLPMSHKKDAKLIWVNIFEHSLELDDFWHD